jgi:hypothetical protein
MNHQGPSEKDAAMKVTARRIVVIAIGTLILAAMAAPPAHAEGLVWIPGHGFISPLL